MTVQIESDQALPPGAAEWIERRARFAFGRYASEVRRIRIRLRWLPSPVNSVAVSCRGMRALVTAMAGGDPLGTIDDVLGRASRQLDRRLRLGRALAQSGAR
jgi:hypothetical protein